MPCCAIIRFNHLKTKSKQYFSSEFLDVEGLPFWHIVSQQPEILLVVSLVESECSNMSWYMRLLFKIIKTFESFVFWIIITNVYQSIQMSISCCSWCCCAAALSLYCISVWLIKPCVFCCRCGAQWAGVLSPSLSPCTASCTFMRGSPGRTPAGSVLWSSSLCSMQLTV